MVGDYYPARLATLIDGILDQTEDVPEEGGDERFSDIEGQLEPYLESASVPDEFKMSLRVTSFVAQGMLMDAGGTRPLPGHIEAVAGLLRRVREDSVTPVAKDLARALTTVTTIACIDQQLEGFDKSPMISAILGKSSGSITRASARIAYYLRQDGLYTNHRRLIPMIVGRAFEHQDLEDAGAREIARQLLQPFPIESLISHILVQRDEVPDEEKAATVSDIAAQVNCDLVDPSIPDKIKRSLLIAYYVAEEILFNERAIKPLPSQIEAVARRLKRVHKDLVNVVAKDIALALTTVTTIAFTAHSGHTTLGQWVSDSSGPLTVASARIACAAALLDESALFTNWRRLVPEIVIYASDYTHLGDAVAADIARRLIASGSRRLDFDVSLFEDESFAYLTDDVWEGMAANDQIFSEIIDNGESDVAESEHTSEMSEVVKPDSGENLDKWLLQAKLNTAAESSEEQDKPHSIDDSIDAIFRDASPHTPQLGEVEKTQTESLPDDETIQRENSIDGLVNAMIIAPTSKRSPTTRKVSPSATKRQRRDIRE